MIPLTMYKAFDGEVFDTPKACADYETHCRKLAIIIDKLPRFDHDSDGWIEGKLYYQHDPKLFMSVFTEFCEYLMSRYPENLKVKPTIAVTDNQLWNVLYDAQDKPSLLALSYFNNVDIQYRQFSHQYFAINPGDAKSMNPYNEKKYNLDTIGITECNIPTVK
jgi:hypothetical protein